MVAAPHRGLVLVGELEGVKRFVDWMLPGSLVGSSTFASNKSLRGMIRLRDSVGVDRP